MAEHAHDYDSYTVAGHPRPQPTYDYAANDADEPRSPLTGRDPNFLDALLPPYVPASPRASPEPLAYQSFYAAYRPGASPSPPPTFLDTILNPAGLDHNRFSPFSYRPSPPAHRQQSALDMPPNTRARAEPPLRPARLPNGYVDLTATPDSPPQRRKRQSPTPGPSAKRQKREDGAADKCEGSEALRVEEVDLTDDNITVKDVLQKQREDAVQAQKKPEEKPTTFNSFNCVICMDMPTDLTATACGAFSLCTSERRDANNGQATSSATRVSWRLSSPARTALAQANPSAHSVPSAASSSTAPRPATLFPCSSKKAWLPNQERRPLHHPVRLHQRYSEMYLDLVFS
jgi:hypothetical protein